MVRKGNAGQVVTGLIWALVMGMVVTILCAMIIATLISEENIDRSTGNMIISVTLLLSAAIAALTAARKTKLQRLPACLAGAGTYYLGLLCCGALLFDGVRSNVGVTALVAAGGGLSAALLGKKKGKSRKYRLPKLPR